MVMCIKRRRNKQNKTTYLYKQKENTSEAIIFVKSKEEEYQLNYNTS